MKIIVNAKTFEITNTTLNQALSELGFTNPAIATALNGTFVARDRRDTTILKDGDRLEVLSPMQGG